jgi:membrane associated rhomboid family serine protease
MALLMAGLNLVYLVTQPNSGVSYVGHLGGGLTGYLYLKRVWRLGEFYRELRWKLRRRRFRVMPPDDDRWVN